MWIKTTKPEAVNNMYGAILGDIIDNPYEFDRGNKTKESPPNENKNTLPKKETIERSSLFLHV